jgi:hypothetical protein
MPAIRVVPRVSGPTVAACRSAAASWLLLLVVAPHAAGQLTSGTILGTISDRDGGVLPGVAVSATNIDTGLVRSVTRETRSTSDPRQRLTRTA